MRFGIIAKRLLARQRRKFPHPFVLPVAGVAGAALAGVVGLAAAQSPTTLRAAHNPRVGQAIVVDSRGVTVYELRPETIHHLLCTKASGCFAVWPPLTVGAKQTKITAVRGVTGKVGILHRNGISQVTLGGRPLYYFAGDGSKKGLTNGQGIHTFGGTWHVVFSALSPSTNTTTTQTAPTMTTPTMTTTTPTTTPTLPYYPPVTTPTLPYYPPGY
jgi:predicted lipoprotein with Yx(FWY)xxD motif